MPPGDGDFVIYSCVTNAYDHINPVAKFANVPCIMFSDSQPETNLSNWTLKKISPDPSIPAPLVNRYHKFHPHLLFPQYRYSLYIDANIVLVSANFIMFRHAQLSRNLAKISIPKHPLRNCVYEEGAGIIKFNRDSADKVQKSYEALELINLPRNIGFFENNLIWREHNDVTVTKVMECVWEDLIAHETSSRDQLSLVPRAWQNNLRIDPFWSNGRCCRNTNSVHYVKHGAKYQPSKLQTLKGFIADFYYAFANTFISP